MKLPYHPRWINCLWASLAGYFWLPCPICGRNFGGHEWLDERHTLWDGTGLHGIGTCPKCRVAR